jgi:hypothetical protein
MRLARSDDTEESEGIIVSRASHEFTASTSGSLWIDGKSNDLCGTVAYAYYNYTKKMESCAVARWAYCEYGGKH